MTKFIGKRILPLLLSIVMVFTLVPAQILSAETVEEGQPKISDYETFVNYLYVLEELAYYYKLEVDPNLDPLALVIKYVRTGVDRYNSGSWGIMAGYEDKGFAEYVKAIEDEGNVGLPEEEKLYLSAIKNIENFYLPNGDYVDIGHMFGTMDITYHNKGSINHADVGGWAGDLVDLLSAADRLGVSGSMEEMVAEISENILGTDFAGDESFSKTDILGDLDAFYIMNEIDSENYYLGDLANFMFEYFTEDLTVEDRAKYFLNNRLDGVSLRENLRNKVYNTYLANNVITTLEATREFENTNIADLRKACCYAFADYICKLAGDYVDSTDNAYYDVFSTESSNLAPGITQDIKYATTSDNKQMVYYLATADLKRDDINVYANYNNNDPAAGWAMQRVIEQANAAQNKYGNPESEHYIKNYNVIASINGAGFNMATGEPSGLLVMGGVEYQKINANGFFGVLKDGTPVIGTTEEYNTIYKDKVQEGIAQFGATLVKDGKIAVSATSDYYNNRASRTAVGITKTGKVVFMVLDGRQEPVSCGGSMEEIAHIMLEAGCVIAINLDGGGSSTFVAKQEGEDKLSVVNRPSDGYDRSVSTSLIMVSTAPSSTEFDHAVIESEADYLTVGSKLNLSAMGVSATGNAAELPLGTTWAVSDETIGTITQNGTFTATANGEVDIKLMLGDEVLATKTLGVVIPEGVFFTKTALNAVYGSKVSLPLKATYAGKNVIINAKDISLTMNNSAAGKFDGMYFIGSESSAVKTVTIAVTLANAQSVPASLTISLFNQGEAVFDFDQATGGDRQLAWDRVVSNSTTTDNVVYNIVDPDSEMVTSYIFAIDMSKIDIPEQLADLTYMLPGADIDGANAWTFLCQLAERVSDLTTVKPVIKFDADVDVDYSNLTLVNDYFDLAGTEFDKATNAVTLTLKWKKQTEPINISMANPICIVSGIKLTPKKDADWGSAARLSVVNSGEIGYDIYLRASALFSFANKPENQEQYGLYPFENPNDPDEKGGHFSSVYKEFEDNYTLVSTLKNGWVNENGGFAYYVDGEKLTGIHSVGGYYYDFGENGINIGQTKFTGVFYDESVKAYRYSKLGILSSGWQTVNGEWYHFNDSTLTATTGRVKMYGVYYSFKENGKLSSGVWGKTFQGTRYYYGPSYYIRGWYNIDGVDYYFKDGYRCEGIDFHKASGMPTTWYDFGPDGSTATRLNGVYLIEGSYRYFENGIATEKHLIKVGEDYYYTTYDGYVVVNRTISTASTNCDLPKGTYTFGADGKMLGSSADGEIVEINGVLYYYEKGKGVEKYLVCVDGEYYFAQYKGELIINKTINAWATNCDLPKGTYTFGADGKMLGSSPDGAIVEIDGERYYYENGKGVEKGLVCVDGDYYFALYKGELIKNRVYNTYKTSCDLPNGKYEFGADGKMVNGIVEKDGKLYYYENGQGIEKGLFKYEDNYYFALYKGELITNRVYNTYKTSCDLPNGRYEFDADGKMLQGIVEKADGLYYYENGVGVEKGLIKYEGNYYFTLYQGRILTNRDYNTYKTSCDLPNGRYEFGADGKMLQGIVEKDGKLYYYENGKGVEKGLFKYEGDYYFALYKGELLINRVYNTYKTSCDLPNGRYEFGKDGKMLNGIVEKEDGLYYYENGKGVEKGLFKYEGNYYFALYQGKILTNRVYQTYKTSCDLPNGKYEFGLDGKMLDGIVEKEDGLYYYENGVGVEKGLFIYNGYYYFSAYQGKLVTNREFKIWRGNELLVEQTYTFNELGQIIA